MKPQVIELKIFTVISANSGDILSCLGVGFFVSVGLIQFDEFALDCDRYELLRAGRPIKLEKIPMELLILLATKDGHLVKIGRAHV